MDRNEIYTGKARLDNRGNGIVLRCATKGELAALLSLLREGDLVTIERFLPKNEARYIGHLETSQWVEEGQRVIKLTWTCPTCAARHEDYIPESFIRQKKAIFVEVTGTEGEEA